MKFSGIFTNNSEKLFLYCKFIITVHIINVFGMAVLSYVPFPLIYYFRRWFGFMFNSFISKSPKGKLNMVLVEV